MDEYRVLRPPVGDEGLLLGRPDLDPIRLAAEGHDAPVEDLRPGYLIEASLDWTSDRPTVDALALERPTLFAFVDDADPIFEAATETWNDARRAGDGMSSRVTRNTDNEVNGVLYAFAAPPESDRFEEFRRGHRPIDPLLDRVDEARGPAPREVFVLRPPDGEFVVVTITLRKGGQFAETMRETYDVPRPTEPLVDG